MHQQDREKFPVRVPVKISQEDDGTIVVHKYRHISHFSDRGNDAQMLPHEYAAFCDLMLDKTIRWTAENADTAKRIKRDADLYVWWLAFIEGPLSQVPIGDEQFRKSRAGLIHHTLLNSIRKSANLSPSDFKALSLAEVFAVISDIHCREHNEENRLRKQASGRKPDADQTIPPAVAGDAPLFGMDIHEKSKTVTRRDSLGIERTCAIKNPEQWKLFTLVVKHKGTLSKSQVHSEIPVKDQRDRSVAALRKCLQEIQLTFNALGNTFVLKEFSGR